MVADELETLRLPLSGRVFLSRSDGAWRDLDPAQYADEQSGEFEPVADDWTPADEVIDVCGRAEWGPGSHDDEQTW
jgi:hypothetical protein